MPTLTSRFTASVTQGAQSIDPDITSEITVGKPAHESLVTVAGASSATYTTLWDSSASPVTTFTAGYAILDPEKVRETAQDVDFRVTSNSSTYIIRRNTNYPVMTFGPSAQGSGAITKIEVANKASTTAGTDDVDCLLRLFK